MRFFINFLKALGVFTIWGLGAYLVFKFLYATWLEPYLDLMVLVFVVTRAFICALAAFLACDMEDLK